MKPVWLAAAALVCACGHSPAHGGDDQTDANAIDASAADAGSDGWIPLISRTWTLGAGQETYECRRILVTQDLWVSAFRALSPVGTDDSVLTISASSTNLGDYDCTSGDLDPEMLYAAGVDTDDLNFPDGVAVHITAGQYINLNLHLVNPSSTPIATSESGLLVKTVPAAAVINEADMTFAGTFTIDIPSDNLPHTAVGGCTVPNDWHVVTLWPHMHQTAIHQTLTVATGASVTTMLDTDYSFLDQRNYPTPPSTMFPAGNQVAVTCTYQNDTGHTITFGDGASNELCFTGLYKYPTGGGLFECASQ